MAVLGTGGFETLDELWFSSAGKCSLLHEETSCPPALLELLAPRYGEVAGQEISLCGPLLQKGINFNPSIDK